MSRLRAARLPAPWHLLAAFSRYPHLDWSARLQVARALVHVGRAGIDGAGISFGDWLRSHGQSERSRQAFWEPFMVPALNAELELVSAEAAGFVLKTAFMSDAAAARFGFATVPLARFAEAAARRLAAVHLRASVHGLIQQDGSFRGIRLESGDEFEFDAVVLAIPPRQLARLLGQNRLGIGGLDAFQTEPIVDVHLWYEGEPAPFAFAALLRSPVQWIFQKAPGYLCCSLSAAHELVRRPESELVELCARELEQALPTLTRERLRRGAATRDADATFIPRPGLKRPGPRTTDPAVAIAGAWTDTGWPATMESAILSGRAAARAVLGSGIPVAA
jgi:squalene-associated FAD-dependent desaturase